MYTTQLLLFEVTPRHDDREKAVDVAQYDGECSY